MIDTTALPVGTVARPTSLGKVLAAATQAGWDVTVAPGAVRVKDTGNPQYTNWSNRAVLATVATDGFVVTVTGGAANGSPTGATLGFASTGAFAPLATTGGWPFTAKMTLLTVLECLANYGPIAAAAEAAERAARLAANAERALAAALTAQGNAEEAVQAARAAVVAAWTGSTLPAEQVALAALDAADGPEAAYLRAKEDARYAAAQVAVARGDLERATA